VGEGDAFGGAAAGVALPGVTGGAVALGAVLGIAVSGTVLDVEDSSALNCAQSLRNGAPVPACEENAADGAVATAQAKKVANNAGAMSGFIAFAGSAHPRFG
jgi:hypothetical protein